jgi:hypothetical protein
LWQPVIDGRDCGRPGKGNFARSVV